MGLVLGCVGLLCWTGEDVLAAGCPNEDIRLQQVYASTLPDCRAYEQVSPTHKNLAEADGGTGVVVSSPSGESVTYESHFPFPGASAGEQGTYLSSRGEDGWSTQDLAPFSNEVRPVAGVGQVTDDLADVLVFVGESLNVVGGLSNAYFYLRSSATGEERLLAESRLPPKIVGTASGDSRVLFEIEALLDENGEETELTPHVFNLYEWDEGRVSLIEADANAGDGSASHGFYVQNAISPDGSRVFFTSAEGQPSSGPDVGQIYVRENLGERVKVSAGEHAQWLAASATGRLPNTQYVFYVEDGGLYRAEVGDGSPKPESLVAAGEGVQGILGISEDGAYAYFVATGILAGNENGNKEKAAGGASNLYMWHEGDPELTFIAQLNRFFDFTAWTAQIESGGGGDANGERSSRVTPAGTTLLFSSVQQLAGYDNEGCGGKCQELYLYDAPTTADPVGKLACVSCNPTDARPTVGSELLASVVPAGTSALSLTALTRNLSDNGDRVFFETAEGLLPQDKNGLLNVYEWEREGDGSCVGGSGNKSGGCLYLISTGTSTGISYFGDASAEGEDVFFFTSQSLVSQDQDFNADIYDARVDGGISAQNAPAPVPCVGEVCHGVPAAAPTFGAPSSATFAGSGNLAQPPATTVVPAKTTAKCAKGKKLSRGKCAELKTKSRRKPKKARRAGRDRRAKR